MRLERLVIEAGENTLTLDLHPRLTVVAGMGRVERESLVGELIGALGGTRPGLHLEVEERSGRHLSVFRPTSGRHRIVDVDRARDVTVEFTDPTGGCNLLDQLALDSRAARRLMRFGAADLAASSHRGHAVDVLASLDQTPRVGRRRRTVPSAERDLTSESEAIGSAPEDAAMIEAVEARHIAVEEAAERFEQTRKRTFYIGGACAALTVPAVGMAGATGLLFVAIALVAVAASLGARANARTGCSSRGEGSRGGRRPQLPRVPAPAGQRPAGQRHQPQGPHGRRLVPAGPLSPTGNSWPATSRSTGRWPTARRSKRRPASAARSTPWVPSPHGTRGHGGRHRRPRPRARHPSGRGALRRRRGLPLLLDDPFRELDRSVKPLLLELLGRSAGEPQIIFLTEDEDVASWARLEALTGEVALIEPAPEHEDAYAASTVRV